MALQANRHSREAATDHEGDMTNRRDRKRNQDNLNNYIAHPQNFMDFVQAHERAWGTESYKGRPALAEIMSSPVVVFWLTDDAEKPYKITLHPDTKSVEKHLLRMIFGTRFNVPNERLVAIFELQQKLSIRGVKILFKPEGEEM